MLLSNRVRRFLKEGRGRGGGMNVRSSMRLREDPTVAMFLALVAALYVVIELLA